MFPRERMFNTLPLMNHLQPWDIHLPWDNWKHNNNLESGDLRHQQQQLEVG
jgi:hypothetical protein